MAGALLCQVCNCPTSQERGELEIVLDLSEHQGRQRPVPQQQEFVEALLSQRPHEPKSPSPKITAAMRRAMSAPLFRTLHDSPQNSEPSGSVRFDFRTLERKRVTLYFRCKPLGIVFDRRRPTRVSDFHFNSQAQSMGVEKGWTIVRVGDTDVRRGIDNPTSMSDLLRMEMVSLPYWSLRTEFLTPAGHRRRINFTHQPLGLIFQTNSVPLTVKGFKPNSYAQTRGVQVEWTISRIANVNVASDPFAEAFAMLLDGLSRVEKRDTGTVKKQKNAPVEHSC